MLYDYGLKQVSLISASFYYSALPGNPKMRRTYTVFEKVGLHVYDVFVQYPRDEQARCMKNYTCAAFWYISIFSTHGRWVHQNYVLAQ